MGGRLRGGHDDFLLNGLGLAMTKWVYSFGDGKAEGDAGMKNLLGGKGANLAEMSNLGLPVPPGFSIFASTEQLMPTSRSFVVK